METKTYIEYQTQFQSTGSEEWVTHSHQPVLMWAQQDAKTLVNVKGEIPTRVVKVTTIVEPIL